MFFNIRFRFPERGEGTSGVGVLAPLGCCTFNVDNKTFSRKLFVDSVTGCGPLRGRPSPPTPPYPGQPRPPVQQLQQQVKKEVLLRSFNSHLKTITL